MNQKNLAEAILDVSLKSTPTPPSDWETQVVKLYVKGGSREEWLNLFRSATSQAKEEEHQFFLNILDGIDKADEWAGNQHGGTQAIRHALKSRSTKPSNSKNYKAMKPSKTIKKSQVYNNQWFFPKGYIGCCDCGLIHKIDFRLKNGRIQIKVNEDRKLTNKYRMENKLVEVSTSMRTQTF
jgi:hypothetical protein